MGSGQDAGWAGQDAGPGLFPFENRNSLRVDECVSERHVTYTHMFTRRPLIHPQYQSEVNSGPPCTRLLYPVARMTLIVRRIDRDTIQNNSHLQSTRHPKYESGTKPPSIGK
jgi:hypothetical protein